MEYPFGSQGLLRCLILGAAVFSASCEQPRTSTAPDRRWAASTDHCAAGGLYGDGVCDHDCPLKDPDCSDESTSRTAESKTENSSTSAVTVTSETADRSTAEESDDSSSDNDNSDDDASDDESAATGSESSGGVQPGTSPIGNDDDDDDHSDDESTTTGSESSGGVQPGTSPIGNDDDDDDQSDDESTTTGSESSGGVQPGTSPIGDDDDDNDNVGLPDAWNCSSEYYGDGTCDCGCGVIDADCSGTSSLVCVRNTGCSSTTVPDYQANHLCTTGDGWTCHSTYWSDNDCDCGCGAVDPACGGISSSLCDFNHCEGGTEPHSTQNYLCVMTTSPGDSIDNSAPEGWTCDSEYYGDSECDCGCGIVDSDCSSTSALVCDSNIGCSTSTVPNIDQNNLCDGGDGWTCLQAYWHDNYCDCGCGLLDPDCGGVSSSYCSYDNCTGDTEPHEKQNYLCVSSATTTPPPGDIGSPPQGWTCPASHYGNGVCTCGCGAPDIDCPTSSALDCEWNEGCPAAWVPKANQNHECHAGDGWTCHTDFLYDENCDCGCGHVDPHCGSPLASACHYEHCSEGTAPHSNQNYICVVEE